MRAAFLGRLVGVALAFALASGCAAETMPERFRSDSSESDLSLGVFNIDGARGVIDGDTIRVDGIDDSLRLVGLDAEERFEGDRDRSRAERDFDRYAEERRGGRRFPVKYGTPAGEEGARWARSFFEGVARVRVELDRADRTRGYFDRYLVHVFALDRDGERHFNLEAVRAGMSPYFTKYGRSVRFDREMSAAQSEARSAGRGIWSRDAESYPDYDERLAWWDARAEAVELFDARGGALRVNLLDDDALSRLEGLAGREVAILAELGRSSGEGPPFEVPLSHRRGRDLPLVCDDVRELDRVSPSRLRGAFVVVEGIVSSDGGHPQLRARDVTAIRRP